MALRLQNFRAFKTLNKKIKKTHRNIWLWKYMLKSFFVIAIAFLFFSTGLLKPFFNKRKTHRKTRTNKSQIVVLLLFYDYYYYIYIYYSCEAPPTERQPLSRPAQPGQVEGQTSSSETASADGLIYWWPASGIAASRRCCWWMCVQLKIGAIDLPGTKSRRTSSLPFSCLSSTLLSVSPQSTHFVFGSIIIWLGSFPASHRTNHH